MNKYKFIGISGCFLMLILSSGVTLFATGSGTQGCIGTTGDGGNDSNCQHKCSGPDIVQITHGGAMKIGASCDHGTFPASCGSTMWDCGNASASGSD